MTPLPPQALELHESVREPSGRPFAPVAEAELRNDLLGIAEKIRPRAARLIAVPELVAPFGTADLVIVEDPQDQLAMRLLCGVPSLLNRTDADIVSVLSARARRDIEDVLRALMWDDISVIARRLPKLQRIGAVHQSPRGGYLRNPHVKPLPRLHAVEAKVRDWRGGIDQVRTYALWADSATLMVGRLPKDRRPVLEEASRWSVGLADRSEVLIRPRLRKHTLGRRLWASEHVAAAFVGADV